ncbi:hypothetical protein HHI36_022054 [Cryptolaemus montrouzieri]|uniref:THAP-type domain-containing protein n=1 Tax=Cryptolaemus montrouzieri TaxID=559131 RepID=A0ABD2MZY9_9CUCU
MSNISTKVCSYMGCNNKRFAKNNSLSFFRFPCTKSEILNQWITNSGNSDLLLLTKETLKNRTICEMHFPKVMIYVSGGRKRLQRVAVPMVRQVHDVGWKAETNCRKETLTKCDDNDCIKDPLYHSPTSKVVDKFLAQGSKQLQKIETFPSITQMNGNSTCSVNTTSEPSFTTVKIEEAENTSENEDGDLYANQFMDSHGKMGKDRDHDYCFNNSMNQRVKLEDQDNTFIFSTVKVERTDIEAEDGTCYVQEFIGMEQKDFLETNDMTRKKDDQEASKNEFRNNFQYKMIYLKSTIRKIQTRSL